MYNNKVCRVCLGFVYGYLWLFMVCLGFLYIRTCLWFRLLVPRFRLRSNTSISRSSVHASRSTSDRVAQADSAARAQKAKARTSLVAGEEAAGHGAMAETAMKESDKALRHSADAARTEARSATEHGQEDLTSLQRSPTLWMPGSGVGGT